ncbi:MAG: FKBP-type peptidyl-prolyl cis-trans isomerase [Bacteroidota bacterium]
MKKILLFLICGLLSLQLNAQEKMEKTDSLSYSVGVMIAQSIKSQGLEQINTTDVAKGLNDVLKGNPLLVNQQQAQQIFQEHMMAQKAKAAAGLIKPGKDFLEKNAKEEGVVTLPSGLQYKIMTEGTGPIPQASDKVAVHYHGTLIDGTVFDSSVERGKPASFPVTGVIQGWVEALQLMPTGSKWKLFIPYNLAYGDREAGPKIKAYSTLIFEVELLKIE